MKLPYVIYASGINTFMAINFTTFFTRLGHLAFVMNNWNVYLNTTLPTDVNSVTGGYTGDDLAIVDGIMSQLSVAQSNSSFLSFIQSTAQQLALTTVNDDNPQLSNTDLTLALKEIIKQMYAGTVTVKKCTVAATVTAGTGNHGDGVCLASVKRGDGLDQENLLGETVTVKCSLDQNSNPSLAFNENFQAAGQNPEANPLAFDWPLGSGATVQLSAINGDADVSEGNILTNSGFNNFTDVDPDLPDNWTVVTGTTGVSVKKGATVYTGDASLEIVGDGAELTKLTQTFNDDTGTAGTLADLTQYAVACWLRVSAVPVGGVLVIDLIDGSNAVINDQQGAANSISVNLNTLSNSSWTSFKGIFRTPQVMPDTIKVRIRLSTALDNAVSLFVDKLGLGEMTSVYDGGPAVAVFSGSVAFYAPTPNGTGDYFSAAITNNYGGASNQKTFQAVADRFYNMKSLNLVLPSASSPSISDGLIA